MDEKSERHVELVTRIANLESIIEKMEGTKNELHQEQRQLTIQVDKSREKMARCRNEKEANAVQRELEEIRRLTRDRDFEIQKLSGLIDDARADLAKIEGERQEIASQIDETQGEASKKVHDIENTLAEQVNKRTKALEGLAPQLRRRYEVVVAKRGIGAAAVKKGSCSTCHIELSPMQYQEIMRLQELSECPSCHCILYYEVESDEPTSQSDDASQAAEN